MSMPAPYAEADDKGLVEGCIAGDDDAWRVLAERHGRLVDVVIARVIDERRAGALADVPPVHVRVMDALKKEQAAPLRHWSGTSKLRTLVALVARRVALTHSQDDTPPASLLAPMPTPASLDVEDVSLAEPSREVSAVLDRLAPNVVALVRLRLRGLERDAIAQTLGVGVQTVSTSLEKIAQRLGETHGASADAGVSAWRLLLDVAGTEERVRVAARTEDEAAFRAVRSVAQGVWRLLREKWAAPMPQPRGALCLDDRTVAGFVDGTLRGPSRARVEGHVLTCARCIDEVATLANDLVAVDVLREAAHVPHAAALAAACLATTRFRAGEDLALAAAGNAPELSRELVRVAQLGRALAGGGGSAGGERRSPSVSGISTRLPTDDEAPLVAIEALVAGDPDAAARAVDDEIAKRPLGSRLRLLADAAGHDLARAATFAAAVVARPHGEPGLEGDAETVLALPPGRALPREVLHARLRDALPDVVRAALDRAR